MRSVTAFSTPSSVSNPFSRVTRTRTVKRAIRYRRFSSPTQRSIAGADRFTQQARAGKNKGDSVRPDVAAVRRGGLEAAGDAELAQDVRHVHAGGFLADVEGSGDLGVGQAVAEQRNYLALSWSQAGGVRGWWR